MTFLQEMRFGGFQIVGSGLWRLEGGWNSIGSGRERQKLENDLSKLNVGE